MNEDPAKALLTRYEVERNKGHAARVRNQFSSDVEVEQGAAHRTLHHATKERGSVDGDQCSGFDVHLFVQDRVRREPSGRGYHASSA